MVTRERESGEDETESALDKQPLIMLVIISASAGDGRVHPKTTIWQQN